MICFLCTAEPCNDGCNLCQVEPDAAAIHIYFVVYMLAGPDSRRLRSRRGFGHLRGRVPDARRLGRLRARRQCAPLGMLTFHLCMAHVMTRWCCDHGILMCFPASRLCTKMFTAAFVLYHTEPHMNPCAMDSHAAVCVHAAEASSSSTYRTVLIVVGTLIGVLVLILAALVCSYVFTRWCDAAPAACECNSCFAHARQQAPRRQKGVLLQPSMGR